MESRRFRRRNPLPAGKSPVSTLQTKQQSSYTAHLQFVHFVKHQIQIVTVFKETISIVLVKLMPVLARILVERFYK